MAWAAHLGIDFMNDCAELEGRHAGGIDRSQRVYRGHIHGNLMGCKVPLSAVFNPNMPFALLGREDFFAYFKVEFDQRAQTFRLKAYATPPPLPPLPPSAVAAAATP